MVAEVGQRIADAEQQHEPAERIGGWDGPSGAVQLAVQHVGVGVGHDDLGGQLRAVVQLDVADAAVSGDARDAGAEPQLAAERDEPVGQRLGQPVQPAVDVPGAEAVLEVRHHRQRGRRVPRVGALVGGVALEHHALPRVGQHRRATERNERCGATARRSSSRARRRAERERAARRQARPEDGFLDGAPDRGAAVDDPLPRRAGAGTQSAVEGHPLAVEIAHGVDPRAVGEAVVRDGVEPAQRQHVRQRVAGGLEQVRELLRQRQQRRAGVEGERAELGVAAVPAELAADDGRRLAQRHAVSLRGEAHTGGQAADAGPDHDDTSHPIDSTWAGTGG